MTPEKTSQSDKVNLGQLAALDLVDILRLLRGPDNRRVKLSNPKAPPLGILGRLPPTPRGLEGGVIGFLLLSAYLLIQSVDCFVTIRCRAFTLTPPISLSLP